MITNKHFKQRPWLEVYLKWWNWLAYEIPFPGGFCIKQKWYIDFQKGSMPLFLLILMVVYNNFSLGAWCYFGLHGSYGLLWIAKGKIFPD
jgi:hypothetical protein